MATPPRLEGKRVLLTGASRGIGRALLLALVDNGARVAACYHRQSEEVEELRRDLEQLKVDALLVQADLTDADSVARFVGEAGERLGELDVLINNAGVVSHAMLGDLELAEWHRVLDTNLTSMYLVVRAALPLLRDGGAIVNVTSAVALRGIPARTHYIASKAGVIGLTRALCKELGPRGIRVNALAPGIVETDQASSLDESARRRYAGLAALNRLGDPHEVASAALFLASDAASFISGVTLYVDGGI